MLNESIDPLGRVLPDFPPPNDPTPYPWEELMIGIPTSCYYVPIIEDLWPTIIAILRPVKEVDINGPYDEAWFHLRRCVNRNTDHPSIPPEIPLRIEILRLRKQSVSKVIKEELRSIAGRYSDVICAGWWGTEFDQRHGKVFLSFVQKLSTLRTIYGIKHPRFLAQTPTSRRYDQCPYCQKAYEIMISPGQPWSIPLAPWFDYFSSANLDSDLTYEYAHWFGHILSGWEGL